MLQAQRQRYTAALGEHANLQQQHAELEVGDMFAKLVSVVLCCHGDHLCSMHCHGNCYCGNMLLWRLTQGICIDQWQFSSCITYAQQLMSDHDETLACLQLEEQALQQQVSKLLTALRKTPGNSV